jgi:hypothetical protein
MAANNWTEERRQRQSEAIQRWKPWEKSTGPKTIEGKQRSALNPYKGGERRELRELNRTLNACWKSLTRKGGVQ